jgi:hypothetical protein
MVDWAENVHPRAPAGSKSGGQFVSSGGGSSWGAQSAGYSITPAPDAPNFAPTPNWTAAPVIGGGPKAHPWTTGALSSDVPQTYKDLYEVGLGHQNADYVPDDVRVKRGVAPLTSKPSENAVRQADAIAYVLNLDRPINATVPNQRPPVNDVYAPGVVARPGRSNVFLAVVSREANIQGDYSNIHDRMSVVIASIDDPATVMLTGVGNGKAIFIINDKSGPESADTIKLLSKSPDVNLDGAEYSLRVAVEEYRKTGDMNEAQDMYRKITALHELSHMADFMTNGALTRTWTLAMTKEMVTEGLYFTRPDELQKWYQKNLTGYTDSAQELMAESAARYFHTGKLPGYLQNWGNAMLNNPYTQQDRFLRYEDLGKGGG